MKAARHWRCRLWPKPTAPAEGMAVFARLPVSGTDCLSVLWRTY